MRGIVFAILMLASAAFAALPVQAQEVEQAAAPTREELIWQFVRSGDNSAASFAQMAEDSVMKALGESDGKLPVDVEAWMTTSFRAAAAKVIIDIKPILEQKLFEAYAAKLTVEDIQKILAFQAFVQEPARAAIIAASDNAGSTKAKFAYLKEHLPADEFKYMIETMLTPPMLDVTLATLAVSKTVREDFSVRFKKEVLTYCGTAPKGLKLCMGH